MTSTLTNDKMDFATLLPTSLEMTKNDVEVGIKHAANCPDCMSPSCQRLKRLMSHPTGCEVKASGGCKVCQYYWQVVTGHAKKCHDNACPVMHCKGLRRVRSSSSREMVKKVMRMVSRTLRPLSEKRQPLTIESNNSTVDLEDEEMVKRVMRMFSRKLRPSSEKEQALAVNSSNNISTGDLDVEENDNTAEERDEFSLEELDVDNYIREHEGLFETNNPLRV